MFRVKFCYFGIAIFMVFLLLAACTPAQTQSPTAAATSPVPLTAATGTTAATSAATLSATAQAATASPTTAATAAASPSAQATVAAVATAAATSAGTGSTGSGVKYVIVPAKSEASYSVREQLARLKLPSDAVGTTKSIDGAVVVNPDGSIDQANSKFTVDLTTLHTDSSMRDGYVSRNILQTSQYPQAVFVPTGVSGLPAALPQSGAVAFKVTGNMTLHGVTKPVTWDVTGNINNGEANGKATTSFTFADFNLNQPQVPVVLSVEDKITLNVTVDLTKSGS